MDRRVLFVANIAKHIIRFHLPFLKWFQDHGFETHVAAYGKEEIPFCDVQFNIEIERSPLSYKNVKAHCKLKKIIEANNYLIIHGHTPMGGFLARTGSVKSRREGTKVLYTAHGFHFFKGAPLKNWLFFYPIELWLSRYTDGIITINHEDYALILKNGFKSPGKYFINGVGVNERRFRPIELTEKRNLRHDLGYRNDQIILIYAAEFIERKNHRFIIEATPELSRCLPNIKIIFAGRGQLLDRMRDLSISLGLQKIIDFTGFRADIEKLMAISDIGISASRQEGLGLNLAEEMLIGLPIIATQDRGHRELVMHGMNGFLFNQGAKKEFIDFVCALATNPELRDSFAKESRKLAQAFTLSSAIRNMGKIYVQYIK